MSQINQSRDLESGLITPTPSQTPSPRRSSSLSALRWSPMNRMTRSSSIAKPAKIKPRKVRDKQQQTPKIDKKTKSKEKRSKDKERREKTISKIKTKSRTRTKPKERRKTEESMEIQEPENVKGEIENILRKDAPSCGCCLCPTAKSKF